jgi:hypothetical protein
VSCRVACETYGRVTCLTYQNVRACEHYRRDYRKYDVVMTLNYSSTFFSDMTAAINPSMLSIDRFDAVKYSGEPYLRSMTFKCISSEFACDDF